MKLHDDKTDFRAAISSASSSLNMQEHIVEKDYWVTMLLREAATSEYSRYIVFKGGTSLSKAYGMINRFSEDVDIALKPDAISSEGIHRRSGDAIHRVIKRLKLDDFRNMENDKESEKLRYKRVYSFPQLFNYPKQSPIHDKIILEVNAYSNPLPIETVPITSLIAQHLSSHVTASKLNKLQLSSFDMNVLSPERTFCEKILALRRAAYQGGEFFSTRIRHVYDVHQLYLSKRIKCFIESDSFITMLNTCYTDDKINQEISKQNQQTVYSSDIFIKPNALLNKFQNSYKSLKSVTYDGNLPSIEAVEATMQNLHARFKEINF